jgi:hypothetical protein
MIDVPIYPRVTYWVQNYGGSDAPDKRAVQDFMDCESEEQIRSLRGELYAISQGRFDKKNLDANVGKKRETRHGSYDTWAKMMLLWMASYKS